MTPDMKRLVEAVWKTEIDGKHFDHQFGEQRMEDGCLADKERHEAIVRAVLTALRDVSEDVAQDGGLAAARMSVDWEGGEAIGRAVTTAMIDAILSEPGTA